MQANEPEFPNNPIAEDPTSPKLVPDLAAPISTSSAENVTSASDSTPVALLPTEPVKVQPKKSKKRKRKVPRDETAPRVALSGYVRYLNERRDQLRAEHPELGFAEVTRQLASEWSKLPADDKRLYLKAAQQDKERYIKEWAEYKKTDSYKVYRQQQLEQKENALAAAPAKKAKNIPVPSEAPITGPTTQPTAVEQTPLQLNGPVPTVPMISVRLQTPPRPPPPTTPASGEDGDIDIPIFTEQFLQHNKQRETELKQLRKANSDYEQQNAILQRHAEEVSAATERLRAETAAATSRTAALLAHRRSLVATLTAALSSVALPGGPAGASEANIEEYMEKLQSLATASKGNTAVKHARDILNKIELPIN